MTMGTTYQLWIAYLWACYMGKGNPRALGFFVFVCFFATEHILK